MIGVRPIPPESVCATWCTGCENRRRPTVLWEDWLVRLTHIVELMPTAQEVKGTDSVGEGLIAISLLVDVML